MSQTRDRVFPVPWQLTGTMRSTMFAKILRIRLKFVLRINNYPMYKMGECLDAVWQAAFGMEESGRNPNWVTGMGAQERSRLGEKDDVWIWTHCLWGGYEITSWRGKPVFRSMDVYLKRHICTWYAELRFISFGKRGVTHGKRWTLEKDMWWDSFIRTGFKQREVESKEEKMMVANISKYNITWPMWA